MVIDRAAYLAEYRYGISQEQFQRMRREQNGRCLSCGERKRLNVDHDHVTGEVRGLICFACNLLIGFIERRGNRLNKVLHYLEAF